MAGSPFQSLKFKWIFFAAWVLWVIVHAIILTTYGFPLEIAFIDGIISNLILAGTAVWLLSGISIFLPVKNRYTYLLVMVSLFTMASFTVTRFLLMALPLYSMDYELFISNSGPFRLASGFLLLGVVTLVFLVWQELKDNQEETELQNKYEKMAREAELHNLRQQLQPHFLFNSLNSINALVVSDTRQARTMITQLSDYLRGTIRKADQQWNTIETELRHLELYLSIEQVRFGDRLIATLKVEEDSLQAPIPALLLQPIMENAIKFGLYGITSAVEIKLYVRMVEGDVEIIVTNPFDPEYKSARKGTGFGLQSVTKRLQLLYGRTGLLSTHTQGNLFITRIILPSRHVQSIGN